jgi:hypothetical protein
MPRPRGVPNKIGAQAKENIVAVFTRLGGTAGMADWARNNQTEFYRLYAKLIPSESTSEISVRDAKDFSTEELLAIVRAGQPQGELAEPDCEPDDELH